MLNNTNIHGNAAGMTVYQLTEEQLWNFGLKLIAKARDDAERQRKEERVEELASRQEVCDYLHISYPTFHSLVNRGLIKTTKVGTRTLCDMSEIRRKVERGEFGKYKHHK